MKPEQPKPAVIATMSRRVDYDDGSGPRLHVFYDSSYKFGDETDRYVRIEGVGNDDTLVFMRDVPMLIEALQEAQRLHEQAA